VRFLTFNNKPVDGKKEKKMKIKLKERKRNVLYSRMLKERNLISFHPFGMSREAERVDMWLTKSKREYLHKVIDLVKEEAKEWKREQQCLFHVFGIVEFESKVGRKLKMCLVAEL
jgi:predicted glycosyltransferase